MTAIKPDGTFRCPSCHDITLTLWDGTICGNCAARAMSKELVRLRKLEASLANLPICPICVAETNLLYPHEVEAKSYYCYSVHGWRVSQNQTRR